MHIALGCVLLLVLIPSVAAQESMPGVRSHYQTVTVADGVELQTILTVPVAHEGPLHPLLFTQWVSCSAIEYRSGVGSYELLASLARETGLALIRVERSALRKSGPVCEDLDYDTEVSHYVDAFAQRLKDPRLDASRVYLYGNSLGSTTAPLVAEQLQAMEYDIAGIAVQGGGALTHFERMLNFERMYLERRPAEVHPSQIFAEMQRRIRFQYEYLIAGRHPDEIAKIDQELAAVRRSILGMDDQRHYGRPFEWHQQAAKRDFLSAWAGIEAPVLVIFNAFDQFETRHGHKVIVDMVNRLRPGTATFVERAAVGHDDYRYDTIEAAYAFEDGTPTWQETAKTMTSWFLEQQ